MTRIDILFETDRFNVSNVMEHFINPGCFGEDVAEWLRQRLTEKGTTASTPGQEDWGWYLFAQRDSQHYFLGISGYRRESATGKNDGDWRVMVEKKRSIWEKVRGTNKITDDDSMLAIIEEILREQADIGDVRREIAAR
jgi:hypothetical protein